jgi:uncharacterized protein with HEPN domain
MCAGLSFDAFERDDIRTAAAERVLEIISEATRHLPGPMLADYPNIPWPAVRAIGNRLRHEYWRVDRQMIWLVLERDLRAFDQFLIDADAEPDM